MASNVKGFAGSARIRQLKTRDHLRAAEKHGKRLDKSGKERSIRDAEALTRSGLDLVDLYDKHVEGLFVQANSTMAMHILIQFPKLLVDENDPDLMLDHAISFCRYVFGENSVFADRIDRDEKNQHVVDVFVAPTYLKVTKHTSKPAVSSTRHLKALAKKHSEPPVPPGYGRALQTEFFEYLRDKMALEGVLRGEKKVVPGSDFKTAEQQRLDELDGLRNEALDVIDHNQEGRDANLYREIELDERERGMRQREALLDNQASEQAEAAAGLADQWRRLEQGQRDLAEKLDEIDQIKRANEATATDLAERERSLRSREAGGARRDDARRAQQATLQAEQRELEERERFVDAFEAGVTGLASGELYCRRNSQGDYTLFCRASPARTEELSRKVKPSFERLRDLAQLNAESVAKEVDKVVAEERDMISSLQLAYKTAIEAARAQADSFRRLISRLGAEARKLIAADKELREAEAKAIELAKSDANEIPDELSVEQLAYHARIRGGSGIG